MPKRNNIIVSHHHRLLTCPANTPPSIRVPHINEVLCRRYWLESMTSLTSLYGGVPLLIGRGGSSYDVNAACDSNYIVTAAITPINFDSSSRRSTGINSHTSYQCALIVFLSTRLKPLLMLLHEASGGGHGGWECVMGTHSFCIEEDMLCTFHHHGCPPSDVLLSSSIVIIDMMSVVSVRDLNYQRLLANDSYVSKVMCEALLMEVVHRNWLLGLIWALHCRHTKQSRWK